MNYNFTKLSKDIIALNSQQEFIQYLEFYYQKIEQYFTNLEDEELQDIKFDIEDFLYDMLDNQLILKQNHETVNAFLILLAEKFIQTSLIGAITIIRDYLPLGVTSKRLDASILYLRVNDISNDYKSRCDEILSLLEESAIEDEYSKRSIESFFYFVYNVFYQFNRVNDNQIAKEFIEVLNQRKSKYTLLRSDSIKNFLSKIDSDNLDKIVNDIKTNILSQNSQKTICAIDTNFIAKESSIYSEKLYGLENVNFDSIRDIAYKYLQSIGDPEELYYQLQRGEVVIENERLLYKYLVSFGRKHKVKLYSAYEKIISKLQNNKFNIVDWGAGQATATMLLLNYAKEKGLILDIEDITLIEPSQLALQRGLLHIDLLKQKEYQIKTINSDLDCLKDDDLTIDNSYPTLHLFSNILDLETFVLDDLLLKKVSKYIDNKSIFICVSPNRNAKLNNRLETFYKFFDEQYETTLISSRSDTVEDATRYEKIFEVTSVPKEEINEVRNEIEIIKSNYQLNAIDELVKYETYVTPILNLDILKNTINSEPDYAIFKVRKVAEVITSNVYSNYEDNTNQVSFNDKIRYLSFEKKVFNKSITNYAHTIRTIGNAGVHSEDADNTKLTLDAHLIIIALISYINELRKENLI